MYFLELLCAVRCAEFVSAWASNSFTMPVTLGLDVTVSESSLAAIASVSSLWCKSGYLRKKCEVSTSSVRRIGVWRWARASSGRRGIVDRAQGVGNRAGASLLPEAE